MKRLFQTHRKQDVVRSSLWKSSDRFEKVLLTVADVKPKVEKEAVKMANTVEYNGYIFRNDEECKFPISDGVVEVDLFDKEGKRMAM